MTTHPVPDLTGYLAGTWRLHREIHDPDGAPLGTFTGTATFTPREADLDYVERGTLSLGGYSGPAHRALRYHVTGPGQAAVHFDHGGFFHDLDLRDGLWRAEHPCSADLYRGEFHIQGPDRWIQHWSVSGPTKNHALTTTYLRESDPEPAP